LESGIVTRLLEPLKLSAPPYFPLVQDVLAAVPFKPLPEPSTITVPEPASNPYAATGVGDVALGVVALAVLL
jgi:hypothetical protein